MTWIFPLILCCLRSPINPQSLPGLCHKMGLFLFCLQASEDILPLVWTCPGTLFPSLSPSPMAPLAAFSLLNSTERSRGTSFHTSDCSYMNRVLTRLFYCLVSSNLRQSFDKQFGCLTSYVWQFPWVPVSEALSAFNLHFIPEVSSFFQWSKFYKCEPLRFAIFIPGHLDKSCFLK